jgi:hypothetical protein
VGSPATRNYLATVPLTDRVYGRLGARYTDFLIGASLLVILLFTALHPLETMAFLGAGASDYGKILIAGTAAMLVAAVAIRGRPAPGDGAGSVA